MSKANFYTKALNKLTYRLMSRLTTEQIMDGLLNRGCHRYSITTNDGVIECVGTSNYER